MSSGNTIISREEYQVKKLMEGLNKAKNPPAEAAKEEKDTSKEINQHMPKYIVQAPWYLNQKEQSLAHQKAQGGKAKVDMNEWYQRGVKEQTTYKYRKGACENCGAITHKTKDCCERPRKVGAKFSGKDIRPDEYVQNLNLDYESKRDRWNGYDPEMYMDVIREHEEYEEARKEMRHNQLEANQPGADESHIDDEFKERMFDNNGPVTSHDPKIKTNNRNLRIREDIAKYLLNLDENSAYYDGKTHSMRENPNPEAGDQIFKGDNFARLTGDTVKLLEQEKFVWDLLQKENAELNSVALPTATEMIYRKAKEKLTEQAQEKNRRLVDKYGEKKESDPDYNLLLGESEKYVEYLPDGKIKNSRNLKPQAGKSRYEEDVFPNDHASVWGSWWNAELGWGFKCCHQTERDGMCLGEKGKKMALVKEFKLKKAKQEKLASFAKEVGEHEAVTEQPFEEEMPQGIESKEKDNEPQPEVLPLEVKEPPLVTQKPATFVESEKAALVITKPERKEEHKKSAPSKQTTKQRGKAHESSNSSSDSSSSSGDSSGTSSDSDSASSSSSASSSESRGREKKSKLKEKVERKQKEKKRSHEKDTKNLKKAVRREEEKLNNAHKDLDKNKRKYNSVKGDNNNVSQEEIEAYKLTKKRFDDPMHFA